MTPRTYLAIDLGASSGRHLVGRFDGERLSLSEAYRFENGPVPVGGHLYWDLLAQWGHIRTGLRAAAGQGEICSVGVDTWGVDFGLLGPGDELLANPVHYRDGRTDGLLERAFNVVPREQIFDQTGLQFMQFNTLYQLWSMRLAGSAVLDAAQRMLMMPDLFHWMLTGEKSNEVTNATTTQLFNPRQGDWARDLMVRFDLPERIVAPVVQPGTTLGPLRRQVAEESGLKDVRVVLPGTHDTASAVVAVPADARPATRPNWCYISSGTWSLMGAEVPRPIVTPECLALNFTNEGGVAGTTRLLKNIAGLWLVQECRRMWNKDGAAVSWEDLNFAASAAPSLVSLIDPDDPSFLAPANMPEAIRGYCQRSGQSVPNERGAIIRCALESLALRYRMVLSWLETLIGGRIETMHVVGGGALNTQLCQATADACQRVVLAGPVEATAIGNVLVQAMARGDLASLGEARQVVRLSFPVVRYEPAHGAAWDTAYDRFTKLVHR
jgi:rhamnulokinase